MSKKKLETNVTPEQTDETLENQETNVTPEQTDETLENQETNEESKDDEISDDTLIECKVLQEFKDKYTNEKYKVNKTLKITYKRYKEIINKNKELIKLIER